MDSFAARKAIYSDSVQQTVLDTAVEVCFLDPQMIAPPQRFEM